MTLCPQMSEIAQLLGLLVLLEVRTALAKRGIAPRRRGEHTVVASPASESQSSSGSRSTTSSPPES